MCAYVYTYVWTDRDLHIMDMLDISPSNYKWSWSVFFTLMHRILVVLENKQNTPPIFRDEP